MQGHGQYHQRFRLPDTDYAPSLKQQKNGASMRRVGHIGDRFSRDESYSLLLELCSQEPTVLSCFKIIESTCLSRGIDLEIRGMAPTDEFRSFVDRYYMPFAANAIRYFFTLGFVPWRLRKVSSGDVVPEIIPLGIFTWTIDSINNRVPRGITAQRRGLSSGARDAAHATSDQHVRDVHQLAAQRGFEKRKRFFEDPKRVPYPLQGDVGRMPTRGDATDEGKEKRLKGFATERGLGRQPKPWEQHHAGKEHQDPRGASSSSSSADEKDKTKQPKNTPAYYRQQHALRQQQQQGAPILDDDDSKILRYSIHFTENCSLMEEDVEIYEYVAPTNSIARSSVLYGTVPSPLSHILVDYRNIRTTQIRLAHADAFNLQAKLICSFASQVNKYNLSEGNPIVSSESWAPQQRMGTFSDTHLPTEMEANAFTRDVITENLVAGKPGVEHKPVVYTLPKNTTLESQPKLESIVDLPGMQVRRLYSSSWFSTRALDVSACNAAASLLRMLSRTLSRWNRVVCVDLVRCSLEHATFFHEEGCLAQSDGQYPSSTACWPRASAVARSLSRTLRPRRRPAEVCPAPRQATGSQRGRFANPPARERTRASS
jgi:hypothetical protein